MSFNTALTSPQLTQLRQGRWEGDQLISFCDNVYAMAAQVNGSINQSGGTTSAVIPFYNVTAGAYTNIDEGMTVIVSPTTDIRDTRAVRLHVRYLAPTSALVYVSEFSDPITNNSYIWVLYHYDIIDNLSRPVGTPIVQYKQFDEPFQRMAPVIRGLQTGYAAWVDSNGHFDQAFDISTTFAAESGASISSYAYSVVATGGGSATVIAGSPTTATVTYRFTFGEYWLKAVVTDSNGVTSFRHCLIKAHDRTSYLPSTHFDGAQINRDVQQGQSARIKGYAGVSSLLNGTIVIIWNDEQYSNQDFSSPAGSLFNNIDLVGWIETEENMYTIDAAYSSAIDVSFEVQGLGPRLMRIEGQMLAITYNASPSAWDQINNLTPWRAIVHFLQRHTTALQLGDFAIDNSDNTFLFPTIVTNAGRALDNITGSQGIAEQIDGQIEFASDGRIQFIRKEPWVATDLGHTPIIVGTWQGSDLTDVFRWRFNHYQQYGLVDADGAAWSGVANVPVMYAKNRAPGLAQGPGPDQGKLNNQILASTTDLGAAKSELSQRAGTQFAMLNNTGVLTVPHPAQFHWLQPSYGQVYIWSLDATFNIRGLVLDAGTHWMLKSLIVRHDNKTGSRSVEGTYIPVLTGTSGTDITSLGAGSITNALPTLPPMPAFDFELPTWPDAGLLPSQIAPIQLSPPSGKVAYFDGNELLAATSTKAYWFTNFVKLATPTFRDVTPSDLGSFLIKGVALSPFYTTTAIPAYILASDGTNSAVWYTANVVAGTVTWTKGATVSGVYTVIRATDVNGGIMIASPNASGGNWTHTFDFTASDGGFTANLNGSSQAIGQYVAATGWSTTDVARGLSYFRSLYVHRAFSSSTITGITAIYDRTFGAATPNSGGDPGTRLFINGSAVDTVAWNGPSGTNLTLNFSGSTTATNIDVDIKSSIDLNNPNYSGSALLKTLIISGTGSNPFGGGSNTGVIARNSSNNGASFGPELPAGSTSPGSVIGFDAQRAGANNFISGNNAIYRATTLGGGYTSYYSITGGAQAVCVIIPYFNWSGTKQTSATNPDIIVALSSADGSSRSLLWIEGGATPGTVHDLTPVAGITFDNANCVTTSYNHHLAVFGLVSAAYKLYRTVNKGSAWTLVGTRTAPKYIRCRRNDTSGSVSGSNKGQLYMADSSMYFSSTWDNTSPSIRNMPSTPILSLDTVY